MSDTIRTFVESNNIYMNKVMEINKKQLPIIDEKSVNWDIFNDTRNPSHPFYDVDEFWGDWNLVKVDSPEYEEMIKCKTLKEYKEKYGKKNN